MRTLICGMCKGELPEYLFEMKKNSDRRKRYCTYCCDKLSKQAKSASSRAARRAAKARGRGRSYDSRTKHLISIGFSSYQAYLSSDLWKEIRRKVYRIKGGRCYLCGEAATELHHNRYHRNDLLGEKLRYINPICHACHTAIEFKDGKKATVSEAGRAFKSARKARVAILRGSR